MDIFLIAMIVFLVMRDWEKHKQIKVLSFYIDSIIQVYGADHGWNQYQIDKAKKDFTIIKGGKHEDETKH